MDNINIRNYIKENFKNCEINDIKESIVSSIDDNDEVTLPGLGVLFEILWKNSNDKLKNEILEILKSNL
ncbi:MAG: small acid-soluble spore protein SspI [Firmicutes bacterium]|nr:small acid-soluble spore protein SspI [Bacillota bacterium]